MFLRKPLGIRGSGPIVLVSVMHITQALFYMMFRIAGNATCIKAVLWGFYSVGLPYNHIFVSTVLMTSAAAAFLGIFFVLPVKWFRVWLFVPQHFILGMMMLGGVAATIEGKYLDGIVIPWQHIFVDQLSFMVLFVIHTRAIILRSLFP